MRHVAKLAVATMEWVLAIPEPMSGEQADRISGAVCRLFAGRGGARTYPSLPTGCCPGGTLYDLVWRRPMTKVAAEFQISDVGLAKICDNHRMTKPLQPKEGILLDELFFSRRIEL
ncbi:hypothetical protein KHP60_12145 [Microvirga sp. 3-52]|uniref:hypothetical protein n=1 Tax=Microvirga sp. 3-52 TaxID=2792425 RepID=UPI001AD55C8A|nr:hypothetical protein [Microvirga sp. 3-52]MBO1905820.1 hypothetical protein [Microvirga sp. 3-52]MBS7453084.1 hypothetical protein [Microvirga sp. 3-52]